MKYSNLHLLRYIFKQSCRFTVSRNNNNVWDAQRTNANVGQRHLSCTNERLSCLTGTFVTGVLDVSETSFVSIYDNAHPHSTTT